MSQTVIVTDPTPRASRRRRALIILFLLLVIAGIAVFFWWLTIARYHETTDDAYVASDVVQITPQIAGTVVAVRVNDTDVVKAGAPLVELDPADARVALEQAQALLAQSVREVRTLYTTNSALTATVVQREADLLRTRDDLKRRLALAGTGAVSSEEIDHARNSVNAAEAALTNVKQQLASNAALIDGTTVENHPNVQRAAARLDETYLALQRTLIAAPVAGQIVKRSVQLGTRVAPGQPLMAIVPLERVWVDANFKEVQLRQMRIGQPATIVADMYGSQVKYKGRIVGLSAGTGAAFALLPAQNATGNWIKIIQRVPVRIALDAQEVAEHPLRVGLSLEVDVDIHDQSGAQLGSAASPAAQEVPAAASSANNAGARQMIRRIILENRGSVTTNAKPATAQ